MTDTHFETTYAPGGAISLREMSIEPQAGDLVTCRARVTVAERELDLQATATGPIGAMTEMLYDIDAGVEIVSLYQQQESDDIVTYLLVERDRRRCWSYGKGRTSSEAAANALVAGANQLYN